MTKTTTEDRENLGNPRGMQGTGNARNSQVFQIRVMIEFETVTLTQDEAVDFKIIAVFFFYKFHRQPFFSCD